MEDSAFEQFVTQRTRDLRRISNHTRSEHSLPEVVNEAWLMARTLSDRKGIPIDFLDSSFQDLLLSHLYQHLVRYTEVKIRHGLRLDQAMPGEDEDACHPLLRTLVSDSGNHPLTLLEQEQEEAARTLPAELQHSQAAAYVALRHHFRYSMWSIAKYLLISPSWAYACAARAERQLSCQQQMPLGGPTVSERPLPRPWRRTRLDRSPDQLAFRFDHGLPLDTDQT